MSNNKTNWTLEQQNAIEKRDKNLLISAGAGSGKTAVLTERIVRLIDESKIDILDMLIVTFTNAAASEMKKRIQKKLAEKIDEYSFSNSDVDLSHIDFLNKQIENVPRASISTVHAFCIKLLRDNFTEIDIDPSFKIIDETSAKTLRDKVLEELFEAEYNKEEESFFSLVDGYSEAKGDRRLKNTILDIQRFTNAQANPYGWLEKQKNFYNSLANADNMEEAYKIEQFKILISEFAKNIRSDIAIAIETIDKVLENYEGLEEKFVQVLVNEKNIYTEAIEKIENNFFDFWKNYNKNCFETLRKPKDIDKIEWAIIKSARDSAKKIYQKIDEELQYLSEKSFFEDIKYLSKMITKLLDLVIDYKKRYFDIKIQNLFLDFSDLEHLTLKVLENEEIRNSFREKYKFIFYDEYQDTNRVQEAIINAIKNKDNLFFVGDVKQSIYKFRLADPTIFNEKFKTFASEEEIHSERIDLTKNFRSSKAVIDFCNLIFENIMTENIGDVEYKKGAHQLISGREDNLDGEVNLIFISDRENDEETFESDTNDINDEEDNDVEGLELEGLYIAKEIQNIINKNDEDIRIIKQRYFQKISELKNELVIAKKNKNIQEIDTISLQIKNTEKAREVEIKSNKIDYKDICILLRSMKNKSKVIEKQLNKFDLPTFVDFSQNTYQKFEIRSIVNYLKIIDNKKQDEALIAVMNSNFSNFTYEDMVKIRKEIPNGNFYIACEIYANEKEDEISKKLREFYTQVKEDSIKEKMMSLSDFIWYIIQKYDFDTFINALDEGDNRIENISSLIKESRNYEKNYIYGLYGFLRHIQPLLKGEVDSSETSNIKVNNAISIMSIHKSKGLEYKVVFLCDMSKKINEQDLNADIILHNELGVGLRYKDSEKRIKSENLIRKIIRGKKKIENISEEIRILYVALTRAEKSLYLVSRGNFNYDNFQKLKNENLTNQMIKGKSYYKFIVPLITKKISEKDIENMLNTKNSSEKVELVVDNSKIKTKIYTEKELTEKQNDEIKKIDFYDVMKLEEIKNKKLFDKYNHFQYQYLDDVSKVSKTSISELIKNDYKSELQYKIEKPNLKKNTDLSKNQIGTIIHLVMQHIPIKNYTEDTLEEEIQSLINKEKLLPEEKSVIDKQNILSFFNSDLGKRLVNSKRIEREKNFLMKEDDYVVEGIIDCFFEEDDEIVIIDYKTDARIDKEKHKMQLSLYKKAVEEMEGKKVKEAYIYWINHNKYTNLLLD